MFQNRPSTSSKHGVLQAGICRRRGKARFNPARGEHCGSSLNSPFWDSDEIRQMASENAANAWDQRGRLTNPKGVYLLNVVDTLRERDAYGPDQVLIAVEAYLMGWRQHGAEESFKRLNKDPLSRHFTGKRLGISRGDEHGSSRDDTRRRRPNLSAACSRDARSKRAS
jgi:hypothetical protein